jgi:hypothetical protein
VRASRLLTALLALYPPWWRARYGDEVRAVSSDLIAGGRSAWRVRGNLLIGAVRTRVGGAATPMQLTHWAARARASIVVATVPVLAVIPMFGVLHTQSGLLLAQTPPFDTDTESKAGLVALCAIAVMAFTALLALSVLAWGYVDLSGAVRKRGNNDRRLRRLVRIPGLSLFLAFALWVAASFTRPHEYSGLQNISKPLDGHPALAHGLIVASGALFGFGLASVLIMVVVVARRATLTVSDLTSGKWVGLVTSVLHWVMAGAAVTSALALGRQGSVAHGDSNVLVTPWDTWWTASVVIVVLAAVVSTVGTANARRSMRVISDLRQREADRPVMGRAETGG